MKEEEDGLPDWGQYRGVDTNYVEPLPWVPVFPVHVYQQATAGEPPEDEDGFLDYEPMAEEEATELTEEKAIARAMAMPLAEECAKCPLLEDVI